MGAYTKGQTYPRSLAYQAQRKRPSNGSVRGLRRSCSGLMHRIEQPGNLTGTALVNAVSRVHCRTFTAY